MFSERKKGTYVQIRRYQPDDQNAIWGLHKAALHGTGADLEDGHWDWGPSKR